MPASSRPLTDGAFASQSFPSTPAKSHKRKASSIDSFGLSSSSTPFRGSSGQRNKEGAGDSTTASRLGGASKSTTDPVHASTLATPVAVTEPPKQLEMDEFLEAEMQGAIFCDPKFVDNFLSVQDADRLQTILTAAETNLQGATLNQSITDERQLYSPLCQVLNAIERAVEHGGDDNQQEDEDEEEDLAFVDYHAQDIASHYDDMAGIKPDLVWFDSPARHWEAVKMPIEVKVKATYLKAGMKQLTRYARAVFAHQLHRRHLYGMVVCKWHATIVRFDRSGILYSEPMDMREEAFRKAFAGLLMLDEEGMGYDTTFTTRVRRDKRMEYYVDLPMEAFAGHEDTFSFAEASAADTSTPTSTPGAGPSNASLLPTTPPTRRLKVVRVLCHRKTIRGRATTVLRVRPVLRSGFSTPSEYDEDDYPNTRGKAQRTEAGTEQDEVLGTRDFVLKLMWKDPSKRTEGDVMERLEGVYGVGQHMWHTDVYKSCASPDCGSATRASCGLCLDQTPDRNRVQVSPNMTDLSIALPDAKDNEEPMYEEVQTDNLVDACAERTSRTYCRLLMSTVGSPLCSAENPRELLRAILDAILGYWKMLNMGLLHRDISDGNVLLLREPHGYRKRKWEDPLVLSGEVDSELSQSEKLLQEELNKLGDPTGILNDFDLFALHGLMGASFFDDVVFDSQESESEDDNDVDEPGSKRRKLSSGRAASPASSPDPERHQTNKRTDSTRTGIVNADKGVNRNIDFRTGTPSFMSTRILMLGMGRPYKHHFTDDLESFFWLIFWCAIEHVDAYGAEPTADARKLLRMLDRHSLDDIGVGKADLLGRCKSRRGGQRIIKTLNACGNSWAKDSAIVHVIVKLGIYFHDIFDDEEAYLQCIPSEVFPEVVGIIKDALEL